MYMCLVIDCLFVYLFGLYSRCVSVFRMGVEGIYLSSLSEYLCYAHSIHVHISLKIPKHPQLRENTMTPECPVLSIHTHTHNMYNSLTHVCILLKFTCPLFYTVEAALSSLESEIVPDSTPVAASTKYRKSLAISLFYKVSMFILIAGLLFNGVLSFSFIWQLLKTM